MLKSFGDLMFLGNDSRTAAILRGDLVAILKTLTCKQTVYYLC